MDKYYAVGWPQPPSVFRLLGLSIYGLSLSHQDKDVICQPTMAERLWPILCTFVSQINFLRSLLIEIDYFLLRVKMPHQSKHTGAQALPKVAFILNKHCYEFSISVSFFENESVTVRFWPQIARYV